LANGTSASFGAAAADEAEVAAGPRHDLAGRELVVAGEVEALELAEDRGALSAETPKA